MKLSLWLAGLFLVVSALLTPCRAETITTAIRKEDPRLEKTVTFASPRIYVGYLLEKLSAQTGVTLTASERDGAADEQIFVHLSGVKLADCLDSLWSLLSYQKAAYSWERVGEPGKYRYRLTRTQAAQKLAQRLQNLTQELFEQQASMLLTATSLPPSERRPIITKMVKEILAGDDKMIDLYLNNERTWEFLAIFFETTPETQLRVLRNQVQSVRVPTSEMSDKGKAFVKAIWKEAGGYIKKPDGTLIPTPELTYLDFSTYQSGPRHISPTLSAYGGGYMGGLWMDNAIRKRLREMWALPDDGTDNPLSARTVPVAQKPEPAPERTNAIEFRLRELAAQTPISIMARLQENSDFDPGSPQEQTVKAYLGHLGQFSLYLQTKWRKDILLVDYPAWFQDEDLKIMLRIVKHLRLSAAEHNGFLTVQDIVEASRILTPEQLRKLGQEFPVMHSVAEVRDVLNALCAGPQAVSSLMSEEGTPLTQEIGSVLLTNIFFKNVTEEVQFKAVRMIVKEHPDQQPPSREFLIGLVTSDGRWRPVTGINNARITPKTTDIPPSR
jgi:hypothetical protein